MPDQNEKNIGKVHQKLIKMEMLAKLIRDHEFQLQ